MSADLLVTKLFAPPARAALVPRPRLVERIDQGVQAGRRLTLVSAPAGFGKTTLVTEWLTRRSARHPQPGQEATGAAWLSLDERDNDPARFLTYVAAALQSVRADVGEAAAAMLQATPPPDMETVLTSLINDVAALGGRNGPEVLVLDDYHLITAPPVHEAVTFLLEQSLPGLHLVLIGRSDPPLALSRLRVRSQMTEIRQADLRFTIEEAVAFLNDIMGLSLSTNQVEALDGRTEGWIAGLQLAAISMRGRGDVAEFVTTFSGSHRYVMDYLAEEVLGQQTAERRRFLHQTAILNRFTAALCDAVTEQHDSQAILARLEQDNLFVIPLDDERRWYRYHHLFADLLRQRLESEDPDEVAILHRRAARWYEDHGLPAEAMDHWLAGGAHHDAALLVEAQAIGTLNRGEVSTVAGWLAALPDNMIQDRAWLAIARAWTALLAGRLDGVESDLECAVRAAADGEDQTAERPVLGHAAAIRAYLLLMRGSVAAAIDQAHQARDLLPGDDASTRSVVTYTLGAACLMTEDVKGAGRAFAEAGASATEAGNIHLAASALSALGVLQTQRGRLRQALATFDRARELATGRSGRSLPAAAGAYNGRGLVLYEWNRLEDAAAQLAEAAALAQVWGNADALLSSHAHLARVRLAQDDVDGAQAILQHTAGLAAGKRLTFPTEALLAAGWAEAQLAAGNIGAARQRLLERGLAPTDEPSYVRAVEHLALARVLVAQDELEPARSLLARLLRAAEAVDLMGRVIEILALQAVVFRRQGDGERALAALERALILAEPEEYVRVFLNGGRALRKLLQQASRKAGAPAFAARLLAAFPAATPAAVLSPGALPVETLTEHELKVLRLVAAGLSNPQVGEQLYLSTNTVKWHLKNIYDKLDVHNRLAAVAKAQELGLL